MRRSSFAVLAGALALLTAVAAALVAPARVGASTRPTIVVGANQKVEIKEPGLPPGPGYAYTRVAYNDPESCGDGGTMETWCNDYTIRLDISDDQLRKNIYLLLVNVDWKAERVNTSLVAGFVVVPQLSMTIWDNPIVEDEEPAPPCPELAPGVPDPSGATCPAGPDEKPGGDEPLYESVFEVNPLRWGMLVDRDHRLFSLDVANYAGANDEYTVTVEVVEVEGTPDLSIDEDVVDLSAQDGSVDVPTAPTSSFDGFADPGGPTGSAFGELGLADLTPDSDLDRLGIAGDAALGFDEDAAELLANRNFRNIRPPGDEDTWALLLWLVVVPIGVAAAAVGWGLKRRSNLLAGV